MRLTDYYHDIDKQGKMYENKTTDGFYRTDDRACPVLRC